MSRSAANANISTLPRRFILLPEVEADAGRHGPRIRRYRLTSVGLGAGRQRSDHSGTGRFGDTSEARVSRVGVVTASNNGDLGPLGRMPHDGAQVS